MNSRQWVRGSMGPRWMGLRVTSELDVCPATDRVRGARGSRRMGRGVASEGPSGLVKWAASVESGLPNGPRQLRSACRSHRIGLRVASDGPAGRVG